MSFIIQPSAAGGASVQAVAAGAINANDAVMVNADGTVSVVSATPTTTASSGASQMVGAFDSANNKVVLFYNVSAGIYLIVGTVSGNGISFGTALQVAAGGFGDHLAICFDSGSGKFVIAYQDTGGYTQARTATVSGTSISVGATTQAFANQFVYNTGLAYDSSASKFLIVARDSTNSNYGTARVGTVSGTTISFGTEVVFNSNYTDLAPFCLCYHSNAQKIVVNYRQIVLGVTTGQGKIATISGTSVSFGSAYQWSSGNPFRVNSIYDTVTDKVLCAFLDAGASSYGYANVQTVTGTTLSSGSNVAFVSNALSYLSGAYDAVTGRILLGYNLTTNILRTKPVTISGTTITLGTQMTLDALGVQNDFSVVYASNAQKLVVSWSVLGGASWKSYVGFINATPELTTYALSATNFLGFAAGNVTSGGTATINIISNEATLSGLTPGSLYYVQSNNTVSTTPGSPSIYAGLAYSSTKLIIKG